MRGPVRNQRRILGHQDGYTLTEMLVVIGIIALIASVLTPQLLGQMSRARAKTGQLGLDAVASAIEQFREDVGRYPSGSEGLEALLQDPGDTEGWTGPYLKDRRTIRDPWNHEIVYQLEADGQRFSVLSYGADGKAGGVSAARDLRAPAAVATTAK